MEVLAKGIQDAFQLLLELDRQVLGAAFRSLWISSLAVGMATLVGLPLGTWLAFSRVPGVIVVVFFCRAAMAMPTVFIGVICFAVFSRRGPLGATELLYTPWAIVIGELMLALPIVASLSHGAIKSLDPAVAETARTLGAGVLRRWITYLSEARIGVVLAVLTAFARCVTELGIAMMVGGNIKDRTRTLATATALETGQGELSRGFAMGLILLMMAVGVTLLMAWLTRESDEL